MGQPANHEFRGYAGLIASGVIRKGAAIRVLPSGIGSSISRILGAEGELEEPWRPGHHAELQDEVDCSRAM